MVEWRCVVGYEGVYEVSSEGVVRRCDDYHATPRVLRAAPNHHGYLNVSLSRSCRQKSFFVHRLVCEAFIGPRPDGATINHKNGDKRDNSLANLEYLSHKENVRHAIETLDAFSTTRARGDRNGSRARPERLARGGAVNTAKLADEQVMFVRQLLNSGKLTQRQIAAAVGISQTQIWRIKAGLSWAHIK